MPPKKRAVSNEKQLKATIKKLRSEVERADAKAGRYKKKADRLQKTADESKAQVAKLSKRLDKATKPAKAGKARTTTEQQDEPGTTDATSPSAAPAVDSSWTVLQLRAEARSRGLTGMSNKSKAQLLDALS